MYIGKREEEEASDRRGGEYGKSGDKKRKWRRGEIVGSFFSFLPSREDSSGRSVGK